MAEAGLSVYAGWRLPSGEVGLDMRGVDLVSFMFGEFAKRGMYLAWGRRIGTGSDGDNDAVIVV